MGAVRRGNQDATQFGKIVPEAARVPHIHRIPLAALNCHGDHLAAHRGFDDLVDLSNAQVVAGGLLTFDLVVDVVPTSDALEERTACSLDTLKRLLYLQTDLLDRFQFRSHHFDADRRAYTGRDHVDARPDREEPCVRERWDLNCTIELLD